MFGVVFYSGAGRWEGVNENKKGVENPNRQYKKLDLPHILVKFKKSLFKIKIPIWDFAIIAWQVNSMTFK